MIVIHEDPELAKLHALVDGARARLAELESTYTIQKAKVDGLQALLFSQLREYHQERERLRLDPELSEEVSRFAGARGRRGSETGGARISREAKAHRDKDYEETAAAMAAKKQLTAEEEAELCQTMEEAW